MSKLTDIFRGQNLQITSEKVWKIYDFLSQETFSFAGQILGVAIINQLSARSLF